jgi:hypothetical protein
MLRHPFGSGFASGTRPARSAGLAGRLAILLGGLSLALSSCVPSPSTSLNTPAPCELPNGARTYLVYPQPDSSYAPANFRRIVVVSNQVLPTNFQALLIQGSVSRYYLPLNAKAGLPYPTPPTPTPTPMPTPTPTPTPTPMPTPTPTPTPRATPSPSPSPTFFQASRNPGVTWPTGTLQVYLGSQSTGCNPALYLGQFSVVAPTAFPPDGSARTGTLYKKVLVAQ